MVFSAAACVAESAYEPHVTYTGSGWCLSSSVDYKDEFYDYFTERFNMDFIPYFTDLDTNDEKVSLLVNTASMPDGLLWMSFSYDSYIEWVDQGLLKPLPEGWEEKYPDLYHNLQMTGVLDKITIDGQVYVIPHSVWNNFVDISVPVAHHYVYYRKDWAKQLGYEFDDTVSITELLEFCRKAIDANLGETGKTVGLTSGTDTMAEIFFYPHGYNYKRFSRTDDGYVWSPSIEGYTDVIAEMRGYYQEGVLDPDYYLGNSMDSFSSGNAAAYYYQGAPYSAEGVFENFYNSHPALIAEHEELLKEDPAAWLWQTSINDYIGLAVLTDKNDTPFATGCSNFWSATIFNPDLDDETFDRILALTDWLSGKEGEVAVRNGVPEGNGRTTSIPLLNASLRRTARSLIIRLIRCCATTRCAATKCLCSIPKCRRWCAISCRVCTRSRKAAPSFPTMWITASLFLTPRATIPWIRLQKLPSWSWTAARILRPNGRTLLKRTRAWSIRF